VNVSRKSACPPTILVALWSLVTFGCYTAQVDPDIGGVFACGDPDGDEPCPAALTCVNERCEDADLVPTLAVLDPEDEKSIMRDDVVDLMMGMPPGMLIDLEIRIQGAIALVSESSGTDPTFGEGHVKVFVDGEEQLTIDDGTIDSSTPVMVRVPAVAGPHRIVLQAYRNDGVAYDNPEATGSRLFWLESPIARRPFVAIKSPLPGAVFDLDERGLDVEVATINFELLDPGGLPQDGRGHAHLYYDDRVKYPGCVQDPGCDNGYLGVAGTSKVGELDMPSAQAGSGVITAVLRDTDHSPYGFPFPCDPGMPGPLDVCSPVFDAIEVVRVDD
jgi:hypothetical protein